MASGIGESTILECLLKRLGTEEDEIKRYVEMDMVCRVVPTMYMLYLSNVYNSVRSACVL